MSAEPDAIREAADLLRSAGYAVVTKTESEFWARWLEESHKRERQSHDEIQQLLWAHGALLDDITRNLAPSRPRWLRQARSWWNHYGYKEPIAFGPPAAPDPERQPCGTPEGTTP